MPLQLCPNLFADLWRAGLVRRRAGVKVLSLMPQNTLLGLFPRERERGEERVVFDIRRGDDRFGAGELEPFAPGRQVEVDGDWHRLYGTPQKSSWSVWRSIRAIDRPQD